MLKTFQSKLRKKNILWLFAGLPEREIVQEGWMSSSMGPDHYQVPYMFTVASIQVLMMYYFDCKNSIDDGHDEDEYWPRDPYIQWKQTPLFCACWSLISPVLFKQCTEFDQIYHHHHHVLLCYHVHPGNSKQPTFPLSGSTWTKLRFQNMYIRLWTIKWTPCRLQSVVQSLVNTGYQLK